MALKSFVRAICIPTTVATSGCSATLSSFRSNTALHLKTYQSPMNRTNDAMGGKPSNHVAPCLGSPSARWPSSSRWSAVSGVLGTDV